MEHETRIYPFETFTVECSCGWEHDGTFNFSADARRAGEEHVAEHTRVERLKALYEEFDNNFDFFQALDEARGV